MRGNSIPSQRERERTSGAHWSPQLGTTFRSLTEQGLVIGALARACALRGRESNHRKAVNTRADVK